MAYYAIKREINRRIKDRVSDSDGDALDPDPTLENIPDLTANTKKSRMWPLQAVGTGSNLRKTGIRI